MTPEERVNDIASRYPMPRELAAEIVAHIVGAEKAAQNEIASPIRMTKFGTVEEEYFSRLQAGVVCYIRDKQDGNGLKYCLRSKGPMPLTLNLARYHQLRLEEEAQKHHDIGLGYHSWEA